jgi:peptide/nickel transport system permease protein
MQSTAEFEALPTFPAASRGWRSVLGRAARKNPVGFLAGLVCCLLVVLAAIGPEVSPYDPNRIDFPLLQAPTLSHPFGTDNLFRDLFSRVIFGARNSLGVGFAAIGVSLALGVVLGITSGYLRGAWDVIVGGIVDVLFSYPSLVLVIFLITIFGRNFLTISVAIGLILTPYTIRVVRSATISIRDLQYVEAAIAVGNSPFRIMYRHILPNVTPYIIVVASVNIGLAILIEASLSFLGLGVSSDTDPSWGRMLQETRAVWQQAWWTAIVPGAAISVAVVAFNVFGDALRDWLDPRLRGSR